LKVPLTCCFFKISHRGEGDRREEIEEDRRKTTVAQGTLK
jgi:hypothetical protein